MINRTKNSIRFQMLTRLKKQKEVERLKKSFEIKEKLFSLVEFIKAKIILFYLSFDGEVETWRMIDKAISLGKKVAVPVTSSKSKTMAPSLIRDCAHSLEVGPFGIFQPRLGRRRILSTSKIDLVIVPAVAFDRGGNRIGRGQGYYDRFLNSLPRRIPTIGLAFGFQVLNRLPVIDSHDFPVDKVLSA